MNLSTLALLFKRRQARRVDQVRGQGNGSYVLRSSLIAFGVASSARQPDR